MDWRGDVLGDVCASAVLISQNDSGASGVFEADAGTISLDVRSGRLLGLSDVVANGGAGADVLREALSDRALSDRATACGSDECEDPCPVADADFPRPADWAALTDFTAAAEGMPSGSTRTRSGLVRAASCRRP